MPKAELEFYGSCTLDQDGCTTCGDLAVPVRIVVISDHDATVEDRTGQQATVAIDFFPQAQVGDVLLVHMGVALARLEESG
jgi:hydrogenase expression/formation protein HypC